MNRPMIAREYMTGQFNCAQSIVKAFAGETTVPEDQIIHLAFPFGGGFGRQGLICGAVSGAAMILGAAYGPQLRGTPEYRETIYHVTQELVARFQKEKGSFLCRDLIHFDLSDPDSSKAAREAGVFTTLCPGFVQTAAEIVEDLLPKKAV